MKHTLPPSIYLDGHSTTPLAPEVFEAMKPWWTTLAANPHSPHGRGARASQATEEARQHVAALVNADQQEIIFTSGATESNNLVVLGVAQAAISSGDARREILISAIEHKSVLSSAASLTEKGFRIRSIPVTSDGLIDVRALEAMISAETLLVSTMAVNNEVGSIQPIEDLLRVVRTTDALMHVDAAQAIGKISIDVSAFDFASLSSHKIYGPMGIGAVFISAAAQIRPRPMMFGGSQERSLRPGTLPTPLVVGFGEASRLAKQNKLEDNVHSSLLSRRILSELDDRQVRYRINVPEPLRVPGSISARFEGVEAASVINKLGNVLAISEGSACTSGNINPSHVLLAMGLSLEEANSTLRMYCSRYNTLDEMSIAADAIASAIKI